MKKLFLTTCTFMVTCIFLLSSLVSCVVDDRYSLSKELDTTVGIGKGLRLPLGSTEKFFISELVDTEEIELLSTDEVGNIIISTGGNFVSESFRIEDTSLSFTLKEEIREYDFKTRNLADSYENLPIGAWPYIVTDTIDIATELKISEDDLPKEVTRLEKVTFKEPVPLTLFVAIYSEIEESQKLLRKTERLNLEGDKGQDGFEVYLPEFIVFENYSTNENGTMKLDGQAIYNESKDALCYEKLLYVSALDFTVTEKGYLEVNNGVVELEEMATAHGVIKSDIVYFDMNNMNNINSVLIKSELEIGEMQLATVEGRFEPKIDPVSQVVELGLDDVEFLKNAYIDVTDPRLSLSFTNPVDATILADATFVGYDKENNETSIDVNLEINPATTTNVFIDRYGNERPGWTNCVVPNLNELIKNKPEKISVDLNVALDTDKTAKIVFGQDLVVEGSYEVQVPLAFDCLEIEYDYSMDNVLGNEPEVNGGTEDNIEYNTLADRDYSSGIYDKNEGNNGDWNNGDNSENYGNDVVNEDTDVFEAIKEIRGVTLSFTVLNTIPVGLKPEISIRKKDGDPLDDVTLELTGEIKRGNMVLLDGVIGEPVASTIKVRFSSENASLDKLYGIDIKLKGTGQGAINTNEYIQISNISLCIDDYIVLDLDDDISF